VEEIVSLAIAMTAQQCHCEESFDIAQDKLRDEAIHHELSSRANARDLDFSLRNDTLCQIASRSLQWALRFPQYRLRECVRNDVGSPV